MPSVSSHFTPDPIEKFHVIYCMTLLSILNDPAELFVDVHLPNFESSSQEHALLSVFAYGTWNDYRAMEKTLPANLILDPDSHATRKLKKLTLLSIFAKEPVVSFDSLLNTLNLSNIVDLESLAIDLMATESLTAKIDEHKRQIVCARCVARCVKNEKDAIMERVAQIKAIRANISGALEISGSA